MAQQHYYEARGELKKRLQNWFDRAFLARSAMIDFSKRCQAAGTAMYSGCGSFSFALDFKGRPEPDPKLWKKLEDGYYKPRRNSAAARKLSREMEKLEESHPKATEVADLIKMQMFRGGPRGLEWHTPRMEQLGGKIVVGVPDDYKVPAKLKGQLVRLSDLAVEKLRTAKKATKAKRKSCS